MTPKPAKNNNHCTLCLNALDDHDGWATVSKYPDWPYDPEDLTCPPRRNGLPQAWTT
jgi:hypothetical protein